MAKKNNGQFLLRIEDIDQTRCTPEFEQAIYDDLSWLGIEWAHPVRRQSDHFSDYDQALAQLQEKGLVYRCFRTRKEVLEEIARAPHLGKEGPEGPIFTSSPLPQEEEQRLLSEGKPHAWRLSIGVCKEYLKEKWHDLFFEEQGYGPNGEHGRIKTKPEIFGDVVIARKDASTSYHIAAVHDDALQGITHIVRGEDLFHASHLHCLLQKLLGYETPVYYHHRLLTDDQGKKFSKRDRSKTLKALRAEGMSHESLRQSLGF